MHLVQVRLSVTRHPVLDTGTRRIHPQIANVAAYKWFPCQARDDGLPRASLGRGCGRNQENTLKKIKPKHPSKPRMNRRRSPFTRQKAAFRVIKGKILQGKSLPMAKSLIVNTLQSDEKLGSHAARLKHETTCGKYS